MALINHATKEITAKIVYYGPGLCGKTTNLQWIHGKVPIKNKGKLGPKVYDVPAGTDPRAQELIRITRDVEDEFEGEDLADVRFVPLIGKEGWESDSCVGFRLPRRPQP